MRINVRSWFKPSLTAVLLLGAVLTSVSAQGIYSCTDSKGRKITSDRPIADCVDREQFELNPSGTVRRKVGPTLTAEERAAAEAREREAAEERARRAEEKRRDHALVIRYPNRAVHDAERAEALAQVDAVTKAATKRMGELQQQRKVIETEMEFYQKDPSKAPAPLKRQVDENLKSIGIQTRFIADQEAEKARVNARFDEDLVKLLKLWSLSRAPAARTGASRPAR
ncbi:MAG: DUF4124 domain-containing protein [Burkholderiaceae bacterium]|jgi:hypothetical protein